MPIHFSLGTPTDQEVPVPLRGWLIPESANVGSSLISATWKITVNQVVSRQLCWNRTFARQHHLSLPINEWHIDSQTSPSELYHHKFASQEQWQRKKLKEHSRSSASLTSSHIWLRTGCWASAVKTLKSTRSCLYHFWELLLMNRGEDANEIPFLNGFWLLVYMYAMLMLPANGS